MYRLLLLLLTIEYVLFFGLPSPVYLINQIGVNDVLLLAGYVFLTALITCNSHGRMVKLKYEQELSIILKCIVCNIVMSIFIMAVVTSGGVYDYGAGITLIASKMAGMTAVQLVSIVLVCVLAKVRRERRSTRRLYLYENYPVELKDSKGVERLSVSECSEEQIHERIMESDEVYLYDLSAQVRNDMMKFCFYNHKPVYFTCKLSDMELRSASIAQDSDKLIFYKEPSSGNSLSYRLKRVFDFVVSGIFIIILLPLFGIIALCIKIDDGGSVFYRQTRCTIGQRQFKIIKFRSMVPNAEQMVGVTLAGKKDARLTRVGYVLRKTKLDELPQLFNILKGDMSFVGPRPERPELIEETIRTVPEFMFRTTVKAGLTGYAQVHGGYHTHFLEKLKWDLMYIENFSLLLDFKILLMTIAVVLRGSDDV